MDPHDVVSAWQEIFQTIIRILERTAASTPTQPSGSNHNGSSHVRGKSFSSHSDTNISRKTTYKNRIFQYGSDGNHSICATGDAHITFGYCTFIGQKNTNDFFLLAQHNSHIEFRNCTFVSCNRFCQLRNSCKVTFLNCEFENCLDTIVQTQPLSDARVILRGCAWKVTGPNCTDDASERIAFHANGDGPIVFDGCHFKQSVPLSEHFELVRAEEGSDILYSGCTFSDVTFPVFTTAMIDCTFESCRCRLITNTRQWSPLPALVENCTFTKCSTCICAGFHAEINQCLFSECSGQLICSFHPLGGVRIMDCDFVRCYSHGTEPDFLIAIDRRCVSTSKINKVSNCYFEDCSYANWPLIGDLGKTDKGYVGVIMGCKFVGCGHDESQIIHNVVQTDNYCGSFASGDIGHYVRQSSKFLISDCTVDGEILNRNVSKTKYDTYDEFRYSANLAEIRRKIKECSQ